VFDVALALGLGRITTATAAAPTAESTAKDIIKTTSTDAIAEPSGPYSLYRRRFSESFTLS
jgi:hypothetical protein